MKDMSYYHKTQMEAIRIAFEVCEQLDDKSKDYLREMASSYMEFRNELKEFNNKYFYNYCKKSCFETAKSACCSYESIIVFFADEVINYLFGGDKDFPVILKKLQSVKPSQHCVYLGSGGCLWTIIPISCAMFFCNDAKDKIFNSSSQAQAIWNSLLEREKLFTWPDRPVLFDSIEEFFIQRGVSTDHMYCHKSPGLLRLKLNHRNNFPGSIS
ncbi:MAG: hypothetical protein N2260_07265 [Syntrophobacterales bacterium]|nr:hypothetical protein [Syntrophobacterales bacterium]